MTPKQLEMFPKRIAEIEIASGPSAICRVWIGEQRWWEDVTFNEGKDPDEIYFYGYEEFEHRQFLSIIEAEIMPDSRNITGVTI